MYKDLRKAEAKWYKSRSKIGSVTYKASSTGIFVYLDTIVYGS